MRVEQMDADRVTRILATNVVGAFVCAREAVRRMATSSGDAVARSSTSPRLPRGCVIIWPLSDEASYTTGAFIDVSGGR